MSEVGRFNAEMKYVQMPLVAKVENGGYVEVQEFGENLCKVVMEGEMEELLTGGLHTSIWDLYRNVTHPLKLTCLNLVLFEFGL